MSVRHGSTYTTPVYITRTIKDFHHHHVPISPNKIDLVKRQHPLYPAQFEQKQAMLRYQTIHELWDLFMEDHYEITMVMQNKKLPNTAPMLFWNNTPWEMQKAQDSGCLCKGCESFHMLRRGVVGACAAIDKIINRLRSLSPLSRETRSQVDVLNKIKDVVSTPSKYDTIVKCLKPCLKTEKLEHAACTCLK